MAYLPAEILTEEFIRKTLADDLSGQPNVQAIMHTTLLENSLKPHQGNGAQSKQELATRRFYFQRCRNFIEHRVGFLPNHVPTDKVEITITAAACFCFFSWHPELLEETRDLLKAYMDAGYMGLNDPVDGFTDAGARIKGTSLFGYALMHKQVDLLRAVVDMECDFGTVPQVFRANGLGEHDIVGYAEMLHGVNSDAYRLVAEGAMQRAMRPSSSTPGQEVNRAASTPHRVRRSML